MIVSNRKLFKKRPARDNLNQAAGIMASSPELMEEVQGFDNGGNVQLPGSVGSIVQMLDTINSIQLPQLTVRPGSFTEKIGMSLSGITDPNERAKFTSKSTKSVVISKVPVKLPSGELGYAVYDNGQLKGYQSEPPGTPMIDRSREIDKISKEVLKEIDPSSVPRTDFSTKDLDPKLRFANELRELAGETDTSTPFGEDLAATREDAANLVEKYPFLQYLVPSQLAKKGIGAVYDYFYGPSKTLQKQYDAEDIPLPIGEDIAGIATNTGRLVDEYGTEDMDVFQPDTITSVAATPKQIFDLISQGTGPKGDPETVQQILKQMEIDRAITPENIAQATGPKVKPEDMITRATLASKDIAQGIGPKVDEDVSKQFQQEVAEKEAAEQFAELNRLMAEGTGPKVPPEGRLSPEETSEDIAEGTGPKVPPEGRPETNKETKEAIVNQTNNIVETTTGSNLDQLMKEFTDKAPEYKGVNKGLAIAKIGFAIAAGKSADGIQNIADGLSMGADMLLTDEKEKNAFNRQIKLASLQYGLGELSKEKAQARADARTFTNFIANKDVTWNGTEYKAGDPIRLSYTDLMKGGIPKEFVDAEIYFENEAAVAEKAEAFNEALQENYENKLMTDEAFRKVREDYSSNVQVFIDSNVGGEFIQKAILILGDEDQTVTGAKGIAKALGKKLADFAGVKLNKGFSDKEEFRKMVKLGFQNFIRSHFRGAGGQSANSISNFDVTSLANAYVDAAIFDDKSVFSFGATNPDLLLSQLQETGNQFKIAQEKSLSALSALESQIAGRYIPGGNVLSPRLATEPLTKFKERLDPYLTGQGGDFIPPVYRDKDGLLKFTME